MVVLMQLVTNLAPIPTVKMVKLDMADHILENIKKTQDIELTSHWARGSVRVGRKKFEYNQCCGSGMFISDAGSRIRLLPSLIPDPGLVRSWIPDQDTHQRI
jgi:hypothetical protein